MKQHYYLCPICKSEIITVLSDGLICSNNHSFSFVDNTEIPVFEKDDENANEYTINEAAEIHDNSLKWLFETFNSDESTLRNNLISKLNLAKGQKILITGVGAGNDLPYIAQLIGKEGVIFAQDYSLQMLMSAVKRAKNDFNLTDYNIEFSVSNAINLPFSNDSFDAAYHFGGLNLFTDIGKGIAEMDRVVKNGGRVVFGDEGLPPWLRDTEYGKMIINNNYLCEFEAPLKYLPSNARKVNLSWEVGYCFYIIDYTVSNTSLPINIDVPHIGKRGGTIRTRYFGKIEGIDPRLKDLLYDKAEQSGTSRVKFLENVLRNGLEKIDNI